jgi:hypothetical protein
VGTKQDDWVVQLGVLRGLTSATGALHDAQVLQLRMWGALAFNDVVSAGGSWEAAVDVLDKEITYTLKDVPKRRPSYAPSLIAALDRSIHFLLGDDWRLIIKENRKLIYKGECVSSDVNEQRIKRSARTARRSSSK